MNLTFTGYAAVDLVIATLIVLATVGVVWLLIGVIAGLISAARG